MKNIKEYIETGIVEMYVMGLTSDAETTEIESLALVHPEIKMEIEEISDALVNLEKNHGHHKPKLSANVKPFLMAIIDYTERLKNGEQPTDPPVLNETSSAADYSQWLNRKDMVFDDAFGDTHARIIGHTPQGITAIVWMKKGSPLEMHDKEYEKFLILEGSCNIITKEMVYSLVPGNYFQIPLHLSHSVEVTSKEPCKVILQRMAA
ncbi:MAG: hypothetical protein V4635_03895 [Bacteroidota bacterium]